MIQRRDLLAGSACALAAAAAPGVLAQAATQAPTLNKPARIVLGFPPGGSLDSIARLLAERLKGGYAPVVTVENRAGAGGSVGAQYVARSKADGYTLVVSSQSSHLANPLTQPKIGYDPVKDFENIAILGRQPNAL
eukprot:gene1395-biopygen1262